MKHILTILTATFLLAAANISWSANIGCGGTERWANLDSATVCATGVGSPAPTSADLVTAFGGSPWTNDGELTGNGTNSFLTANLTSGNWGGSPIAGTWAINASFWATYADAVISIHVGNGNGDPDWFAWRVTPQATAGTWDYIDFDGRGGGLSNIKLWGRGTGVRIPEPSSIALLGLGIAGLIASRRKQR